MPYPRQAARLSPSGAHRISAAMPATFRLSVVSAGLLLFLGSAHPAGGEQRKPTATGKAAHAANGAKAIGHFDDWIAATHAEAGQPVCYAFTRASSSSPILAGRGDVVLTVTQRTAGRDTVAITAGFAYSANAAVHVDVEQASFEFYTAQRSAFARDGHAAVGAFQRGRQVQARSPGPKGSPVVDRFSLRGFSAAYGAIEKACPSGAKAAAS